MQFAVGYRVPPQKSGLEPVQAGKSNDSNRKHRVGDRAAYGGVSSSPLCRCDRGTLGLKLHRS